MNPPTGPGDPPGYALRIAGHLDPRWSAWFGRLTLTLEDDGTTALRGPVIDQAELHGLLAKVRDLGVTLISLTSLDLPNTVDSLTQAAGGHDRARLAPGRRRRLFLRLDEDEYADIATAARLAGRTPTGYAAEAALAAARGHRPPEQEVFG